MPDGGNPIAHGELPQGRDFLPVSRLIHIEDLPRLLRSLEAGTGKGELLRFPKLEIEIGCGNGHFLAEYCAANPATLLFGIEIKNKRCLKACSKIEKRALNNAYVIQGSAEQAIGLLPDESVDTFHIYFPDPWPKSKHRRRRFLRQENLHELERCLKPGGSIFFATDFFDYYLHSKLLFILNPGLMLHGEKPADSVFQSIFGKKYLDMGKTIHVLSARKSGCATLTK
jgi:tRNA (guanine-N(7)-)-methyltransferase